MGDSDAKLVVKIFIFNYCTEKRAQKNSSKVNIYLPLSCLRLLIINKRKLYLGVILYYSLYMSIVFDNRTCCAFETRNVVSVFHWRDQIGCVTAIFCDVS